MKKFFSIVTIAGFLLVSLLIFRTKDQKPTITIRNHTFVVELTDTQSEQERGLSYRSSLDEGSGMLFVFEKPQILTFWMKGMEFPLDIIFIRDNKIITIYKNVPKPAPNTQLGNLPRYSPKEPANYVLEINAGLSEKYDFQEGDSVEIKNLP